MYKQDRELFIKDNEKELTDLIDMIEMLKADGLNRLKIWKEFRDAGTRGDLLVEAFRRTGLFNG